MTWRGKSLARGPATIAILGGLMLAASAWAGPPPPPPPPPPPSSTPAPQPKPQPKPEPEPAPPCPDGGQWKGHAPPHGDAYYCAVAVEGGALQKHGWYVKFYPNGNVQEECEYNHDVRNGRCTFYTRDGVRKSRGFYANGHFTKWWWFWDVLDYVPADDALGRRQAVEDLLSRMGAPADDISPLGQHVLDNYAAQRSDIRLAQAACTQAVCVQAATVASRGIVAIQLSPPESRIEAGKTYLWRAKKRAKKQKSKERWRVKSAAKKAENEKRAYERSMRRWKATPLGCNNGSSSGSCTCGGSPEGCCAYAGGVKGCPREKPTPPK